MTRPVHVLVLCAALAGGACASDKKAASDGPAPAAVEKDAVPRELQAQQAASPSSLATYFATETGPVDTAGVRLIPITTPKGTFNVWTKRFGTNPRIKLLLLHGGPGATHEYFEGLESFLAAEGIEFI